MLIRVEPKDWNMVSVYLLFHREVPDPEDETVKAYLKDRGLVPKRREKIDYHDNPVEMMYFGGCYIRNHMPKIQALHQKGAQELLLRQAIDDMLAAPASPLAQAVAALTDDGLSRAKDGLVERLNVEASFGQNDEGYVVVALEDDALREAFLAEVGTAAHS